MKKIIQISAIASVVLSAILATSCAPTPPQVPNRPTYRPATHVKKPIVTIRNNSYRSIVVGVQGPERRFITVPARSSKTVSLRSGTYKYAAAAKNTRTISGYKSFSVNRRYTWNFGVN
ncbi:MAG: hypothetical protein AB8F34_08535 [Akkermansiaceae bacterium]